MNCSVLAGVNAICVPTGSTVGRTAGRHHVLSKGSSVPLPSFSAVVEWENARLAGEARATAMLRILLTQSAELETQLERPPELIILYDGAAVSRGDIGSALAAAGAASSPFDVRIEAVGDASYYKLKNIGAKMATREFVLFVDSDVLRSRAGSTRCSARRRPEPTLSAAIPTYTRRHSLGAPLPRSGFSRCARPLAD